MSESTLASGTYEVLRNRLREAAGDLRNRFDKLNAARADVFGNIETKLQATTHVTTDHNCVPRDVLIFDTNLLLGYNVQFGLKTEISPSDVFSVYRFDGEHMHQLSLDAYFDDRFCRDFQELYRYYRTTTFSRFFQSGVYHYMVFQVGKLPKDIKVFKWKFDGKNLEYVDNRSEAEVKQPAQYAFRWTRATREDHRPGLHPHISIQDKVFVECIGGDLTVKVEDNTQDGLGIYREPVDNADQTLDDAEIYHAVLGNIILLKIKPYQERDYRYLGFSIKRSQAQRIDSIGQACVLLPDDHGVIFPNGFYLQTGDIKLFDHGLTNLAYEKTVAAPNGEDFLYVFFEPVTGTYLQLRYNLSRQSVDTPLICHGLGFFDDGRMLSMRASDTPAKHHALQVWQTPYTGPDFRPPVQSDSMLFKIGNRDLVRGMAECQEILALIDKDESFADLYADLVKRSTDVLDGYYWISREEACSLSEPISKIREAAAAAVDEFEKVVRVRNETAKALAAVQNDTQELFKSIDRSRFEKVDDFVEKLATIRAQRGAAIQLRERRYIDLAEVEKIETSLVEANDRLGVRCVQFLLTPHSLQPYRDRIQSVSSNIAKIDSTASGKKLDAQLDEIGSALELLIETVSQLKIEDLTQRTTIVDAVGDVLAELNRVRSTTKARVRDLTTGEMEADFASQNKLLDQAAASSLETADAPERVDDALTRILMQIEELEGRYAESDSLLLRLTEKRQSLCNAYESRRQQLVEARTRRADGIVAAADRILSGILGRTQRIDDAKALHAYFASDPMVDKVRKLADQLRELGDTVRTEDVLGRLKTIADDAVRLQRDRRELLSDGNSVIRLGQYSFPVNQQPIELTTVIRGGKLNLHLTGTQFFQPIDEPSFDSAKDLWEQVYPSESAEIYRAEFLAYQLEQEIVNGKTIHVTTAAGTEGDAAESNEFVDIETYLRWSREQRIGWIRKKMQTRFSEGYSRGVHDVDTEQILTTLLTMRRDLNLLTYAPRLRSTAWLIWTFLVPDDERTRVENWIGSTQKLSGILPQVGSSERCRKRIRSIVKARCEGAAWLPSLSVVEVSNYLYTEIELQQQSHNHRFHVSPQAIEILRFILEQIDRERVSKILSIFHLHNNSPEELWSLSLGFVDYQISHNLRVKERNNSGADSTLLYREEVARMLLEASLVFKQSKTGSAEQYSESQSILSLFVGNSLKSKEKDQGAHSDGNKTSQVAVAVDGLVGDHVRISSGKLTLHYHEFHRRLGRYTRTRLPRLAEFNRRKQDWIDQANAKLRTHEFKAKVLTSFVRNQLIDQVYLPRIGDNLAKQIGAIGENKRTDRMGLLLLVSPPGYGKTTLMEYVANRLGLVFVKVNGPAIGHAVTSLDPAEAPNASAREEVNRINLALEMGDNVMLYLDDIQHCDPELLQKFIPLCDATRKIEGVWNGQPKSYDLRGRKVAVVMAGNPYTESGQRFQIPDMLANRADVYNLGEIIGNSREAFELSYLENCLTSNPVLQPLARSSSADQRSLIAASMRGMQEGLDLESNLSADQVTEMMDVLKKLHVVRDVVLMMNREYIHSAAQSDDYRTEPPFKLQGSYRNMNRIAEKIVPVMNEDELHSVILSSYQQDTQTLSRDGESNMLKFKELLGLMTVEDKQRWDAIKYTFAERNRLKGLSGDDSTTQFLGSLLGLRDGLESIRKALTEAATNATQMKFDEKKLAEETLQRPLPEQTVIVRHSVPRVMTDLIRSQFQLLYDGLRPILEQTTMQSQTSERLQAAIRDCLEKYELLEKEAAAAEEQDT